MKISILFKGVLLFFILLFVLHQNSYSNFKKGELIIKFKNVPDNFKPKKKGNQIETGFEKFDKRI